MNTVTSIKKKYFHGTSIDNLESILELGLHPNYGGEIWSCSGNNVYVWSPDELMRIGECENIEEAENRAFQLAVESAQFSLGSSKQCKVVVITIEMDIDFEMDESGGNMEDTGALCTGEVILPTHFSSIQVSNDLSLLKGYFISLMVGKTHSNLSFLPLEIKIGQSLTSSLDPEDIEEFISFENLIPTPIN